MNFEQIFKTELMKCKSLGQLNNTFEHLYNHAAKTSSKKAALVSARNTVEAHINRQPDLTIISRARMAKAGIKNNYRCCSVSFDNELTNQFKQIFKMLDFFHLARTF